MANISVPALALALFAGNVAALGTNYLHDGITTYCWAIPRPTNMTSLTEADRTPAFSARECAMDLALALSPVTAIHQGEDVTVKWTVRADLTGANVMNQRQLYFGLDRSGRAAQIVHANVHSCVFGTGCDPFNDGNELVDKTINQVANFTDNKATFSDSLRFRETGEYSVLAHIILPNMNASSRFDYAVYTKVTVLSTSTPMPSTNTTVPTIAPITAPTRRSNAVTIGATVGSMVVIILIITTVTLRRNKRRQANQRPPSGTKDASTYKPLPDARTYDTNTTRTIDFLVSQLLRTFQIPYHQIQLGQVVSHGGYGEVRRGTYNRKDVAVKCLLSSCRSDPQSLRSFVHEIQLTATLQHECLVQFIGAAWKDASSLCMVSEFMHGGDLRSLLARYAKSGHANGHDDTKLRIAVQVAHAMSYLHSLDPPVVHRDLKSRNILLTTSLDAKLIDFGVSSERQDVTMTAGVGTSLWMAPEVMSGDRYDEKADVFSFGVILSELDTHELPYDHARNVAPGQKLTEYVLFEMIRHGTLAPRFTNKAGPAIVGLTKECLQLDPTKRPTSTELLCRLDQCLKRMPSLSDQTSTALSRSLTMIDSSTASARRERDTFEISLDTLPTA